MPLNKKEHPKVKTGLHPRNLHRNRYNFKQLMQTSPDLKPYVGLNEYRDESIDFFNPAAVKALNKALLKHFYGISYWDIPPNYLCPPIPGRADYVHYLADLLAESNIKAKKGKVPRGAAIKCLDIGLGANCVYPIIGVKEYGWSFVGSDIDAVSVESANRIVDKNPSLQGLVEVRHQLNPKQIFQGIIRPGEFFDVTICNPPFHASAAEALASTTRKVSNLKQKKQANPVLNFAGHSNELWCKGGESAFLASMAKESKLFGKVCFWFSTLVSKQTNLKFVYQSLEKAGALDVRTITMSQGNKVSRLVAWTFLNPEEQKAWVSSRWVQPKTQGK